jgi:hypothetical protein
MKKNKVYLFLLIAITAGACEEAMERSLINKQVQLLAPVDNLATIDSVQTFFWEGPEGTQRYRLQIVSPRFDSITRFIVDTPLAVNRFTIKLNRGTYEWRVRANNSSTATPFSMRKLTIQ